MNHPYAERREKLKSIALANGVQAMLITNELNVSYLTGFGGDSSYLLLTPEKAIMLSDTRYTEQIAEECAGVDAEIRDSRVSMTEVLTETVNKCKISSLAFEACSMTKSTFDKFESSLEGVDLKATDSVVIDLRAVKDESEIEEIRHSVNLAQRAFEVIRASLTPSQTEAEIAHNLEHQIRLFGGDCCAFEPIVGVGPRAALPHALKTDRRIEESPFVLIDWGAKGNKYMSDLTRVLVTGKPDDKIEKIYNIVLEAQLAAIEKIRPGVEEIEVDKAAREHISNAGYGDYFGHGLGHGFGLQIHEQPRLSPMSKGKLQAGMVVTVEPGIYLPGWGGVRIEDDILVTEDGHEVLTSVPKRFEDSIVTI